MLIRFFLLIFFVVLSSGFCEELQVQKVKEEMAKLAINPKELSSGASKICLNMIVKNESAVIRRCLESVKPLIDYWVIVDTGSKDGTQEIIREYMKEIPGELHERPWVNFAHNRNEALQLAKNKGDYLLFVDADDILVYEPEFIKPKNLDRGGYYLKIRYNGMEYDRVQLVSSQLEWKWVGVVHEVVVCDQIHNLDFLKGVVMRIIGGGDRSSDPKKYYKDAQLLEAALKEDPSSTRNTFYLAQSYRDAQMLELAVKNYEKRVSMGGWDQEVFWSLYQIAMLKEEMGASQDVVTQSYEKAFLYRPSRVEPLCQLATYHRKQGNYLLGYLLSKCGCELKPSNDVLFVESWMHEYGLLLERSICAYYVGKYQEALEISNRLLTNNQLPTAVVDCLRNNLRFILDKLPEGSAFSVVKK